MFGGYNQNDYLYQCKHCRHRTTLRSGTVMHGSKLPFMYWFIAMHLLTATKKSISAAELQRQIGHKHIKMIVIPDEKAKTIDAVAGKVIEKDSRLTTEHRIYK